MSGREHLPGRMPTVDRPAVHADGRDLSLAVVEALDAQGRAQPNADHETQFAAAGPGAFAAVGSGDGTSDVLCTGNRRRLSNGRTLVVVRASGAEGPITLTAGAPGLGEAAATVQARPAAPRAGVR